MNAPRLAPTIDIGPLSWVIEEVRTSLANAVVALKAYAAAPQDATQLRFAKTHLHQAHGALQIVDLDGIALITGAVEQLIERVEADQRVEPSTVALVERAFNGLLDYLDDLLAGNVHQPIRLFTHYRDLLTALGAERIHPADLFFPETTARIGDDAPVVPVGPHELHASRARFERGLLNYLLNRDRPAALGEMQAAVRALRGSLAHGTARSFWTVMDGFLTALESEPSANDLNIKRLCARLNLQMRRTIEGSQAIAERLLRDALFFVAVSDSDAPVVQRVRRGYALEGMVPSDYLATRYGRIDAQIIRRAKEQLAGLKSAWDRFVAGQSSEAPAVHRQAELFGEIATQMHEPGLERIAQGLRAVTARCASSKSIPSESVAIETATAMLFVENMLDGFNRLDAGAVERAETIASRLEKALAGQPIDASVAWLAELSRKSLERSTMSTLVAEIQTNLRAVEQALDAFFRDSNKRDGLASTDALLAQTAGALMLLGEHSATDALEFVRAAIARFSDAQYVPKNGEFEQVAQSFGALGFFIDALRQPDTASRPSLELDAISGAYVARMVVEPPLDGLDDDVPSVVPPTVIATTPGLMAPPELPSLARTASRPVLDVTRTVPPAVAEDFEKTQPLEFLTRRAPAPAEPDAPLLVPIEFGHMPIEPIELDAGSVERETQARAQQAAALYEVIRTTPADRGAVARLREELGEIRQSAELLDRSEQIAAARQALDLIEKPLDPASMDQLGAAIAALSDEEPPIEAPQPDAATLALAASDDAVIDAELLEIFLAEAKEVFETIDTSLRKSKQSPSNREHLTTLRRAFHTLKGSSRMVGLRVFGESAWALEQVYNVWLSDERNGNPALFALTEKSHELMAQWIARIEAGDRNAVRPEALIAAANRVREGQDFFLGPEADEATVAASGESDAALDALGDLPTPELQPVVGAAMPPHAATAQPPLAAADAFADVPIEEIVMAVPAFEPDVVDDGAAPSDSTAAPRVERTPTGEPVIEGTRRIGDLTISNQLYTIFLNEADERLRALRADLADWQLEPGRPASERAVRAAHSLSGIAATAGLTSVHDVAAFLEQTLATCERSPVVVEADEFERLDAIFERLQAMLLKFAAGFYPEIDRSAMAAIDELRVAWQMRQQVPTLRIVSTQPSDDADTVTPASPPSVPAPAPTLVATNTPSATAPAVSASDEAIVQARDEIDPDLLDIFIAEAHELMPRVGTALAALVVDPRDAGASGELLRALHTLKGSARMTGAMRLGALLHDMESRIEHAQQAPSAGVYEQMLARHDDAVTMFEAIARGEPAPLPASITDALAPNEAARADVPTDGPTDAPTDAHAAFDVTRDVQTSADVDHAGEAASPLAPVVPLPTAAPRAGAATPARAAGALVRVRSEVLDRLVNQAGEVAIARARLENDLLGVRGALTDLTDNVGRLRGQLREIEIAAEAQMQSRIEAQREAGTGFDPLEFDRFTRLQELTRMLAESVNDVSMLQTNIVKSLDGAGKDLINQARLTRDLQQDLMRVRMVPVDSVAERLYRVVRQAAKDAGKRVALEIEGSNVELDRGVLERMTGPFEHLLRNAIAHGIEARDDRKRAGKAEAGNIRLAVKQEGNEVLLEFTDDGAGLNLPRIRERAFERGLIPAPDHGSDAEAAELIFTPGFSTASAVTELAGRGVGMDVVRSEAAALGGRVEVHTEPGRGARFRIRLPLTLAVTQVVLVRTAGRVYALPSVLVEQVQQLRPEKLAAAYGEGLVEVVGERVPIAYLAQLLGDAQAVPMAQRYSPVIAVRSGGHRIAVHVDEVVGNQEVVVKNIGPQLARMIGVAGATVLGSGDIVLILDPVQLLGRVELRRAPAVRAADGATADGAAARASMSSAPVVMVVDDSVTVRRVTQRLLVREGYQVVLAKDGVDALEQMQEFRPDLMLVDIEMPRMDGFDLTRNVRADERFRAIPVVMITSRTADKHRNHALALGVNVYLGKPYQEDELLGHVRTLLANKSTVTA